MGEIDTKPIESVQTAISLFGEKSDHHRAKHRSPTSTDDEKERELENLVKDLANYKVQLEAKESAYMQAILRLEQSQKSVDELSTLLDNNEIERQRHADECRGARTRMKIMADLLEAKENELVTLRESEIKALARAEDLEIKTEFAEKSLEDMRRELDNQVLSNSILVDILVLKLEEVNQELISSQKEHRKSSNQEAFELKSANELACSYVEKMLTSDLQKARTSNEIEALESGFEDHGNGNVISGSEEVERLRRELEIAMRRVAELRNRAAQASCRAEMAEKAKTAIEDQLRKWREERHKRRASIATLGRLSEPEKLEISTQEQSAYYLPLYKLLNVKF